MQRLNVAPMSAILPEGYGGQALRAPRTSGTLIAQLIADGTMMGLWKTRDYSGAGSFLDTSGRAHHMAFPGAANNPVWLEYTTGIYFYLPGVVGNYLSAPDSVPLSITGDITLESHAALDDWTPAGINVSVGKWTGTQFSYLVQVLTTGVIRFAYSPDGTTQRLIVSTVAVAPADGSPLWVRVTRTVSSGDTRFWTSSDGVTWTQLGTTVTANAGEGIFNSTAELSMGRNQDINSEYLTGKMFRIRIYNSDLGSGSGTPVFDMNPSNATAVATTFTDQSVNAATITINRSATGRKTVVVDRPLFMFGTDDYLSTPDHADFNFAAADSLTIGAAFRMYGTPTTTRLVSKRGAAGAAGWLLRADSRVPELLVADAAASIAATAGTAAAGVIVTGIGVRNVAADNLTAYLSGTAGAAVTDTTTLTLANLLAVALGNSPDATTTPYEGEMFSACVIRKALTAAEVGRLSVELAA